MKASIILVYQNYVNKEYFKKYLKPLGLTTHQFNVLYTVSLKRGLTFNRLISDLIKVQSVIDLNRDFVRSLCPEYLNIVDDRIYLTSVSIRLCLDYECFVEDFIEQQPNIFK